MSNYIIITSAHNEEAFIEMTIRSVLAQSWLPLRWVIVNDASTDRTPEIVGRYSAEYPFIQLINVERQQGRNFRYKVSAFQRGLTAVQDIPYAFLGNLDADISLEPHYFEHVLSRFEEDSHLGIAGGIVFTKVRDEFITRDNTLDSVGGAVQLFRRECFEAIGGYIPLPYGGIDAAAEITARMKGWKVRKFPDNPVYEHRRTGTATFRPLASRLNEGKRFHSLGYGPLFYFMRCLYRLKDPPIVVGSTAALTGYLLSAIGRQPVLLSEKAVTYLRTEQRKKLKRAMRLWPQGERTSAELQ